MKYSTFTSLRVTATDENMTFRQKILTRFNERRGDLEVTPRNLNKPGPFMFIAEVMGVWYYGACHAVPFLYSGYHPLMVIAIQTLVCFLAFEVMVNWWCVYSVDSNYYPQRHGTQQRQPQSLVQVVTDTNSKAKRRDIERTKNGFTSGSYWSWKYCTVCDQPQPPRCHHCSICNRCSLKLDHHCFFARNCIGYRNFRHFTVMVFWACVASVIGVVHAVPFVFMDVLHSDGLYIDILPFVAFVRWIFGYSNFQVGIIILGLWSLFLFLILSTAMAKESYECISKGKTSFEISNDVPIRDSRSQSDKIRAIFGKYWVLNFLLPLHWIFEPEVDPVYWPTINN